LLGKDHHLLGGLFHISAKSLLVQKTPSEKSESHRTIATASAKVIGKSASIHLKALSKSARKHYFRNCKSVKKLHFSLVKMSKKKTTSAMGLSFY
jgi:hypothetical protein